MIIKETGDIFSVCYDDGRIISNHQRKLEALECLNYYKERGMEG